jgi:predicted metal-dependent HD superfamily phosphohydrolase
MQYEHLQQKFFQLNEDREETTIRQCWLIILSAYSERQRHYHTMQHISNLFSEFEEIKTMVKNEAAVSMAIFFHDIVYQPGYSYNEAESADMAREHLIKLNWNQNDIDEVAAYILATKTHQSQPGVQNISDQLLFLDLDLIILGANWESYQEYVHQILEEFGNNSLVKLGRKHFMNEFLHKPRIYHTEHFYNLLEAKARRNIEREIKELL